MSVLQKIRFSIFLIILFLCSIITIPCFAQSKGKAQTEKVKINETITHDAEVMYRFPIGGVIKLGPCSQNGIIWFLSDSKTLYSITSDGVAIGKRKTEYRNTKYLAVDPFGRALIIENENKLVMINKAGQDIWNTPIQDFPNSSPAFSSDGRFFLSTDKFIYAYAPNGRQQWKMILKTKPSTRIDTSFLLGPCIGLEDGTVIVSSIGADTIKTIKLQNKPIVICGSSDCVLVSCDDNSVYIITDGKDNSLHLVNPEQKLRVQSELISISKNDDCFYALSKDGTITAIDKSCNKKFEIKTNINATKIEAFKDRIVILNNSTIKSYTLEGEELNTLKLTNSVSMPLLTPNGGVLVSGNDWILYTYYFEKELISSKLPKVGALTYDKIEKCVQTESQWLPDSRIDEYIDSRLHEIDSDLKNGTINNEHFSFLSAVALGYLPAPFGQGAVSANYDGNVSGRVKACNMLGNMGLPSTIPILIDIFETDPESIVRSAAVSAIANIGLDPNNIALNAFLESTTNSRYKLDARVASTIIDAIYSLYRANASLNNKAGVLTIMRIVNGNYGSAIKEKAMKTLKAISGK